MIDGCVNMLEGQSDSQQSSSTELAMKWLSGKVGRTVHVHSPENWPSASYPGPRCPRPGWWGLIVTMARRGV
jgi:hypothetical protein